MALLCFAMFLCSGCSRGFVAAEFRAVLCGGATDGRPSAQVAGRRSEFSQIMAILYHSMNSPTPQKSHIFPKGPCAQGSPDPSSWRDSVSRPRSVAAARPRWDSGSPEIETPRSCAAGRSLDDMGGISKGDHIWKNEGLQMYFTQRKYRK